MTRTKTPKLEGVSPNDLSPSTNHVRDTFSIDDKFVRNVEKVGLVNPPIVRWEADELRVVDGMRRVLAARKAGVEEIPVLIYDLSESEALEVSLSLNISAWRKSVSERDESSSLRELIGGSERPTRSWETDAEEFSAEYTLGLVDEVDRILRITGDAKGVGEATAVALADGFESPQEILEASVDELQEVPGIGPKTANNLRDHLDTADPDERILNPMDIQL